MRIDEGFLQSVSTGHLQESERCSLFSQSPGFSLSCLRCWAVCCCGWDAANGSAAGLPAGTVLYRDTGEWQETERPLRSRRYGLVGRPDYLVQTRDGGKSFVVPVEVKSRARPAQPYASHILQLATYCLLVEENFEAAPPYGLLRYADATLRIDYTDELRRRVLEAAAEIRQARRTPDVRRSHSEPPRCSGLWISLRVRAGGSCVVVLSFSRIL